MGPFREREAMKILPQNAARPRRHLAEWQHLVHQTPLAVILVHIVLASILGYE